ncbi:hypothetical protein [Haloarcula regularis]|uniref:hypothetical protein n=1 Tax=Haloarcula regularis TaxID=3033392 RepID=UPI0023E8808A|nr:hypothetical protein [Halomicroarcula sp. SYNS111]
MRPSGCRFHTRCPKVIPPDGYDLEQSAWRAVLDFRQRLASAGIDQAGVREFVAASADVPVETVTDGQVRDAVREEFGIPDSLSDPEVDAILRDALELVVDGADDRAHERLVEAFPTVCAREAPPETWVDDDHRAACHLLESDADSPRPADTSAPER